MKWLIFFLLLPHLKPACLEALWPELDLAFDIGRVISSSILIFLLIIKKKFPSLPVWVLVSLEAVILISTYVNEGNILNAGLSAVSVLAVAVLIDFFSMWPIALTKSLMMNLEWLIYCNLLSILITYPTGMYIAIASYNGAGYFLGYHNSFFQYALIAICISMLYLHFERKFIRPICLIVACYVCVIITWSVTSLVALTFVGLLLVLPLQMFRKMVTFPSVFAITMGANLLVSVFRVMDRVLLIAWWIEIMLGKKITLSGRTFMWDECSSLIQKHPVLGYGYKGIVLRYGGFTHVHNQYFELLIEGGIIALTLFIVLNLIVGKKLIQCQGSYVNYIFLTILGGLYIIFIAEDYIYSALVFLLMMLAYHVDKFEMSSEPNLKVPYATKRGYHVSNRKNLNKY